MTNNFDIDQRNQNVQNQVIAESVGNLLIGDNNTVVSNLSDVYKPYLIGLIDNFSKEPYVALSGYTTELPEQFKDLSHNQHEVIENYKNLFDVLKKYSRFVLLGDPGTGKSQIFKFMALQVAKRCLDSEFKSPMPLLIDLSLWNRKTSFKEFVTNHWKENLSFTTDPFQLIEQGAVLLFLDGLNEMGENSIANVEEINNWLASSKLQNRKIFIACRKSDYLNAELKLGIAGFTKVFISPLTDEQITQIAKAYLESSEQFLSHYVGEQPHDSLRLPYTLSRLAILYKISEKYIENPGALNHILVKSLWKREMEKGTLKNAEGGDENDNIVFFMLGQLALRLFVEQEALSFDTEFAMQTFATIAALASSQGKSADPNEIHFQAAKNVLQDSFQLGLLTGDNAKAKFSHQLIFEYFIARTFWDGYTRGADLPFEGVKYDEEKMFITYDFRNLYFADSILESIFVQIFGIHAVTGEELLEIFIYNILKRSNNPFLAADCVGKTGVSITPTISRLIVYELLQKYMFFLYGEPQNNDNPLMKDLNLLRSGLRSGSIQFGIFPSAARDFASYLSKVYEDSSFGMLATMVGEDIWLDYGIMLGLALSGEKGLNFFVRFLNDEENDYGLRSRVARCLIEIPAEKKYIKAFEQLQNNNVDTFGEKGMWGGRFSVGELAKRKLQEIETIGK